MNRKLDLNDDETQELDLSIKQALGSSQAELNHTRGAAYKDRIKDRICLLEQILAKLDATSMPTATRATAEVRP
jgi:hypothetical protein